MSLVATLICNPADPALDSTLVDGARAILPSPGPAHWLFDEVAVDIPFEGSEDAPTIERRLREARGDLPIDIVVQPRAFRRKKLLLADMDSTMIGQECIDELADYVGLKGHVAKITERALRGEIEFEPALRERVALLKGLPVSVVDEVLKQRIRLTPGGRELIATMRAHGAGEAGQERRHHRSELSRRPGFHAMYCRMNRNEALDTLRRSEPDLRARGVRRAAVFGSVARGVSRPDSDIDIMVEIDPEAHLTVFDYAGLKDYIASLFDGPVDVVNRDGLKPYVRPAATADAIYAF